MVATALFVPAFLGLGRACVDSAPWLARVGTAVAVLSMMGFMAVRMVQGVELQLVRDGADPATGARLVDHLSTNPVGAPLLIAFLGGSIVGVVCLALASARAGFSRAAAVALGVFPFLDLALQGHAGTIASHVVLLAGTSGLAAGLLQDRLRGAGSPQDVDAVAVGG
jgi:hypothetical protein